MDVLRLRDHFGVDELGKLAADVVQRVVEEAAVSEALLLGLTGDGDVLLGGRVLVAELSDLGTQDGLGQVLRRDADLRHADLLAGAKVDVGTQAAADVTDIGGGNLLLVGAADLLRPHEQLLAGLVLGRQIRQGMRGNLKLVELLPVDLAAVAHTVFQALVCDLVETTNGIDDCLHVQFLARRSSRGQAHGLRAVAAARVRAGDVYRKRPKTTACHVRLVCRRAI